MRKTQGLSQRTRSSLQGLGQFEFDAQSFTSFFLVQQVVGYRGGGRVTLGSERGIEKDGKTRGIPRKDTRG